MPHWSSDGNRLTRAQPDCWTHAAVPPGPDPVPSKEFEPDTQASTRVTKKEEGKPVAYKLWPVPLAVLRTSSTSQPPLRHHKPSQVCELNAQATAFRRGKKPEVVSLLCLFPNYDFSQPLCPFCDSVSKQRGL